MEARERDLDRLLTFVDAVVAIALTLLVLPLAEAGADIGNRSVIALLRDHLLGFALSFTVIARLWVAQHRIVRSLVRQSTTLLWLLLGWTFTIVFLPFPTALVAGRPGNDALVRLLYIGTMAVSSALLALTAWAIGRDRRLRDIDERPDTWSSAGTAAAFVLALAVSLTFPVTRYWPLLLLLLVDPVGHLVRQRRASER